MISFSANRHSHALMCGGVYQTIINKRFTPEGQKSIGFIWFYRLIKMYIHSFITIKTKSFVNVFKPIYTINNIMVFTFLISYILSRNEELKNFLIIVHINKTSKNINILTNSINVTTINAFF